MLLLAMLVLAAECARAPAGNQALPQPAPAPAATPAAPVESAPPVPPAPPTLTAPPAPPPPQAATTPLCVVELFTSEGCSSCPSADKLASTIARSAAQTTATRTIVLAFHVDYWDALGWKDRFASAQASQRQRDYAQKLGISDLYTPQMIINGSAQFVGSDAARASSETAKALATMPKAGVAVNAQWASAAAGAARTLNVSAKASPAREEDPIAGALLDIMLVESGLVSEVRSGENAGKALKHDRVVRTLQSLPLGPDGAVSATIELPRFAIPGHCQVVAVLREPVRWAVLGAGEAELPEQPHPAPGAAPK